MTLILRVHQRYSDLPPHIWYSSVLWITSKAFISSTRLPLDSQHPSFVLRPSSCATATAAAPLPSPDVTYPALAPGVSPIMPMATLYDDLRAHMHKTEVTRPEQRFLVSMPSDLPTELLQHIFTYCHPGQLWVCVRPVCLRFRGSIECHPTRFLTPDNAHVNIVTWRDSVG